MSKTLADVVNDALDIFQDRAEREIEDERRHKPNAEKELRDAIKSERRAMVRMLIADNEIKNHKKVITARDVIAVACDGPIMQTRNEDADFILAALESAGFVVVPK